MGLKTVVLNSERMNYDGKLDLSVLSSEVKEYASTEQDQILERVQGMDVVVTKEMPVDGDTIARFPDSVQLICEAGTGYNNIAAMKRCWGSWWQRITGGGRFRLPQRCRTISFTL